MTTRLAFKNSMHQALASFEFLRIVLRSAAVRFLLGLATLGRFSFSVAMVAALILVELLHWCEVHGDIRCCLKTPFTVDIFRSQRLMLSTTITPPCCHQLPGPRIQAGRHRISCSAPNPSLFIASRETRAVLGSYVRAGNAFGKATEYL